MTYLTSLEGRTVRGFPKRVLFKKALPHEHCHEVDTANLYILRRSCARSRATCYSWASRE